LSAFVTRLLGAGLLLCSCVCFAAEPQWVEVRSPNFSVITDAGEKRGRDVALHFEQMRSVFGALWTEAHVNLSVPLQIVAFRNTKELRQVAPMFNGRPTQLAGLFQGGHDRSFIMLDMSVENPWTVVFHEYAHQLMNGNLTFRIDPWLEEGFAEYFSSIEVDDKKAIVGKIPDQTYDILHQLGLMKVADLFGVQQNSKTYNESGDHRTTFYAESGLVVHYLYDNVLFPKLANYFEARQLQKKPVEQAFLTAFGMTCQQFDKVLRDYLNSGHSRGFTIATSSTIVPARFTVLPVSLADARAVLADIHAHSPDYKDQALAEFQDVLKIDPNNQSALRGVGYAYLQQRDFENAAEYFRQAAERDSKDPRVHYYYAMLLSQRGRATDERLAEIKKELEASIALDPKFADAYSLLGYAQASSGEPAKGVQSMRKAIELAPRDEHYQFNLANIYMSNRELDKAISVFRDLAASSNSEMAFRAAETLGQAEKLKSQSQSFSMRLEPGNSVGVEERRDITDPVVSPRRADAPLIPAAVRFVKGKLVSVDCSPSPQAVLTVSAGTKSLKLHVRDSQHVMVIGADQLSCDWKNKSMAFNYRERPDGEGDVVSLELQ
jgi:Flp pilus assembly protein TadD